MSSNTTSIGKSAERMNFVLILLRLVAIVLLALSAGYWMRLVGISDSLVRFDTMSTVWKVAATTLVVLQPVAALGLWGGWRWGVVLWVFTALIEGVMYGLNSHIFGEANLLLIFHLVAFAVYAVMAWITSKVQKQEPEEL